MKLSVVVPAYNEEKLIANCLDSIRQALDANARPGFESEILVVDNNSTDRTAELARAAGAQVVFEPINRIAGARNAGACEASGDWLLFIDADSFPSEELIGEALQSIDGGKVVGGGSTLRMTGIPMSAWGMVKLWNAISRTFRWAAGSFIFCRADVFREIEGFSDDLYVSEELDFSRRLKRAGRLRGLGFVILTRHPLETSPRKFELYGRAGILRQWMILLRHPMRSFRTRADLDFWYDGRR